MAGVLKKKRGLLRVPREEENGLVYALKAWVYKNRVKLLDFLQTHLVKSSIFTLGIYEN